MGLFTKKMCSVCGSKLGVLELLPTKLTDGYLCKKCQEKCSPFLSFDIVNEKWSASDVKNHYTELEDQKAKFANEFTETDCIMGTKSGGNAGQKLLLIDKNHGWFAVPDVQEVFELSLINGLNTDFMSTDQNDTDMHFKFQAPRPGMAVPDSGETLISLSVDIHLNGHPYADTVSIPVAKSAKSLVEPYQHYLENIYNTAAEIYDALTPYMQQ